MHSSSFFVLSLIPLFVHSTPLPFAPFALVAQPGPLGAAAPTVPGAPSAPLVSDTAALFLPPGMQPSTSIKPQDVATSTGDSLVMAYYPDWAGATFAPEDIDFARFDWIDFAFALPDSNFNITWDDPNGAPALLRRLVAAAHTAGKKVKLSVGGWTGSRYFSSACATNDTRQLFANNILATYAEYGVDGIDIDWEYPGHEGDEDNVVSPNDTANFLALLQLLRLILPSTAKITAATQTSAFQDSEGKPMQDVTEFAKVLDWILIMNYDVWGSSAAPGPNAPLYDKCHNSTQPGANAVAAYNAWTGAGFPASKMVLGLPSYGYVSQSTVMSLRTRADNSTSPAVTVTSEAGGDGQIQFSELVKQGALVLSASDADNDDSGPAFSGSGGFTRLWDGCSSTPFLRSEAAGQVVTYDDPESLGKKAAFAKGVGMLGVNMFDVHGDTPQWDLTDTVRKAMGRA